MRGSCRACVLVTILVSWVHIAEGVPYLVPNHPCCVEPPENLTLANVIDAYEIYGHDPTDKLDHLWLYQYKMFRLMRAKDQYEINELVHIATDHLARFIRLHIQELKVLLIAIDDCVDNMITMYDNHNSIAAERMATFNGGPVPMEFYLSQEFYCGKNVYLFMSELYSDIYHMGRGVAPYCRDRLFVFLGFVHYQDDQQYYLIDDPTIVFPMDNYLTGLECHLAVCIYRFAAKKYMQRDRDVVTLPKAIVKCGLILYKLPPLTAASCVISSGSFILDFNIQGLRFRHYDYLLLTPNGHTYYTKENNTPMFCDHHVCEWNFTNYYGGPFVIPGEPENEEEKIPPYFPDNPSPSSLPDTDIISNFTQDGCLFMFPPNYGSIAGKSYLDQVERNYDRFTCDVGSPNNKGLYWYPQWMGTFPHHPYSTVNNKGLYDPPESYPMTFEQSEEFEEHI